MIDISKLVRPNIHSLSPYHSAREEFSGEAEVYLDANENPYGTLNRYPDPLQKALKNALCTREGELKPEQIFIGNGSDEVIDLAIRIFCSPGVDEVITCSPTYGMYQVLANINQIAVSDIPLLGDFQLDIPRILANNQAKMIFLCSPNNPTGNSLDGIQTVLDHFQGIVFVDEAYIDFSERASVLRLLDAYPNLIVSQTFSKARGLAAARVGIAYANKRIIDLYNRIKPPYNVSTLNQEAALLALQNEASYRANLESILTQKKGLEDALASLPFVQKIYPSEANFLLVEVHDAALVYQRALSEKIILRNRNAQIKNCLRISVGTASENQALIKVLKTIKP